MCGYGFERDMNNMNLKHKQLLFTSVSGMT